MSKTKNELSIKVELTRSEICHLVVAIHGALLDMPYNKEVYSELFKKFRNYETELDKEYFEDV